MDNNLRLTFELKRLFFIARQHYIEEIQIKTDLLDWLNLNPEQNGQEMEFEEDQLTSLQIKKRRYELLAGVAVIHPESAHLDLFLLTPYDVSVPNHVAPITWDEIAFIKRLL